MADANWMAYLGVGSGIVGAITGISGAVMGYMSLRRDRHINPVDSRFELEKLVRQIDDAITHAEKLLNASNESRQIISAATGLRDVMKWDEDFERDKQNFEEMKLSRQYVMQKTDVLDLVEVNSKLITARKLEAQLAKLSDKYASAITLNTQAGVSRGSGFLQTY